MRGAVLGGRRRGFTVIELLVVLAAVGMLLSIAVPRYVQHLDTAREVVLRQDLRQIREAIDKFYADQARYPKDLAELVAKRYLRSIPIDPITQRATTWIVVAPTDPAAGGLMDLRSGAAGIALDGSAFSSW